MSFERLMIISQKINAIFTSLFFLPLCLNVTEKSSHFVLKAFLRSGADCNLALTSFSRSSYSEKMRWKRVW